MITANASMQQTRIHGASFEDLLEQKELEKLLCLLRENPSSFWDAQIQATSDYTPENQSRVLLQNTPKYKRIIVDSADINQFIDSVDVSCLESGYISRAERFVDDLCQIKGEAYIIQMMNDIYVKYPQDELLMCAVINILSDIDYENLGSFAITLCMGLVAVGTPLVWEYVINACDRWKRKEFIPCLQRISTNSLLLQRMVNKVIVRLQQYEDED